MSRNGGYKIVNFKNVSMPGTVKGLYETLKGYNGKPILISGFAPNGDVLNDFFGALTTGDDYVVISGIPASAGDLTSYVITITSADAVTFTTANAGGGGGGEGASLYAIYCNEGDEGLNYFALVPELPSQDEQGLAKYLQSKGFTSDDNVYPATGVYNGKTVVGMYSPSNNAVYVVYIDGTSLKSFFYNITILSYIKIN